MFELGASVMGVVDPIGTTEPSGVVVLGVVPSPFGVDILDGAVVPLGVVSPFGVVVLDGVVLDGVVPLGADTGGVVGGML